MNGDPYASLRARLDEEHVSPCVDAGHGYTTRPSAAGHHVAVTAEIFVESSAEVIALYRCAAEFDGVISL